MRRAPLKSVTAPKLSLEESLDALPFRQAPHNIEAEQALLGAILINNESFDRVSGFLQPGHFFEPLHGRLYEVMAKLIQAGKHASPVTLKTFFDSEPPIGELTVAQYLGRLAAAATTIINAQAYGRTVYDLAVRRELIAIGEDMVNVAYDSPVDAPPEAQIEAAEGRLYDLADKGKYGSGFMSFGDATADAIEMAARAYERDGGLSGLSTGLVDLDRMMGGLQNSDLIVLAGRPSMGKTALATNIAFNIARAYRTAAREDGTEEAVDGAVVGFFSLEMSSEQLATRILAEQAQIPSEKIRRGQITDSEFNRLQSAAMELQTLPLFIDHTGGISIAQLSARARRLKRQKGLGLIVVDYLQLLTGSARRSQEGRVQEVSEITVGLKALAKELNVPILALSQLSRQVENRDDKRPQLSDLRESGSIEQDADVVMFVFREEYYVSRKEPSLTKVEEHQKWQDEMDQVQGLAEVIVGKQRHGPTGAVRLQFQLHPLRRVLGGRLTYTGTGIGDALRRFRDLAADAPRDLSCQAIIALDDSLAPVLIVAPCYTGPDADPGQLRALRTAAGLAGDGVRAHSFLAQQHVFNPGYGVDRNYWKGHFVRELPDELIDELLQRMTALGRPPGQLLIESLHGAPKDTDPASAALGYRDAAFNISVMAAWLDAALDGQSIAWARATAAALQPWSVSGGYMNYMQADEPIERVRAAFGDQAFERLQALKRRYDPDNILRRNQNIPPL